MFKYDPSKANFNSRLKEGPAIFQELHELEFDLDKAEKWLNYWSKKYEEQSPPLAPPCLTPSKTSQ